MSKPTIVPADVKTLRDLAKEIRKIAQSAENQQRKARWLAHNALKPGEPMVICEVGGLRQNGEHPMEPLLTCQEPWAREMELGFRTNIYQFNEIRDDWVVEPYLNVNWKVSATNYGVHSDKHSGSQDGKLGSYVWEPAIKNLQDDLKKLKPRTFSVDREATMAWKKHLDEVLGDILPTRIRGGFWWTMGLTIVAIDLIGLEQLMLYMVDDPDGLHRLMRFLCDDHLAFARWLEKEGLLTLNNENDYIGSGSVGYCSQLPQAAMNGQVRLKDTWVLSESQETVGVGPDMFAEFIFPYQQEIAERFGLSYYGCCEPVHSRWHVVKQLKNLRKVSVSPWCDEELMARGLGGNYVYCRKPNPALVSTDHFDEAAIRADLRKTLAATRKHGCVLELVMKDVHTLNRQPQRLARWTQLAREEIARK